MSARVPIYALISEITDAIIFYSYQQTFEETLAISSGENPASLIMMVLNGLSAAHQPLPNCTRRTVKTTIVKIFPLDTYSPRCTSHKDILIHSQKNNSFPFLPNDGYFEDLAES